MPNARDTCPDCGGNKLKRASRCKPCANAARIGESRTDTPSKSAGWYRARQIRPLQPCEFEGCEAMGMDRHHRDDNPLNNDPANIAVYCRRHHMTVDGRLEATAARGAWVGKMFGGRPKGAA
jgi:predicted  nucleic acid-binding Zn-ribbon protein